MREIGTLRQLVLRVSASTPATLALVSYLIDKDKDNIELNKATDEQVLRSYTRVIVELLSKPQSEPFEMPILVAKAVDTMEDPPMEYIDVCLLNPNFVEPPEGLAPWGCRKGQEPPPGYYNVNDEKHSKYFAFGFTDWSKIIDTPVLTDTDLQDHAILAEILWELTFYGWTEEDHKEQMNEIHRRCEEAMKDLDEGNYKELKDIKDLFKDDEMQAEDNTPSEN